MKNQGSKIGFLLIVSPALLFLSGCNSAHGDPRAEAPSPATVVANTDVSLFAVDHPEHSRRLGVTDRERAEGKLASWLRKYHRAEVVKETPGPAPDAGNVEFQMISKCLECSGSGKLMEGERCRFCNGAGTGADRGAQIE